MWSWALIDNENGDDNNDEIVCSIVFLYLLQKLRGLVRGPRTEVTDCSPGSPRTSEGGVIQASGLGERACGHEEGGRGSIIACLVWAR